MVDRKVQEESRTKKMHELYSKGATLKEVGDRFGLSYESVRQRFVAAGLPTRSVAEGQALLYKQQALQHEQLGRERSEEICAVFAETKSVKRSAHRLGLPVSIVRNVVKENFSPAEQRQKSKPKPRQYTDGDLTVRLQEAGAGVSGPLTAGGYEAFALEQRRKGKGGWPNARTYLLRFGSWSAALAAAGLPANPSARRKYRSRFDRADCLEAIHAAVRELGKIPTAREFEAFSAASNGASPSLSTVVMRLGTWCDALAEAGL